MLPTELDSTLSDGTALSTKLEEWGISSTSNDLLAQWFPTPLGPLIAQGFFSTTIALGRSSHIGILFSDDVPSPQWIVSSKHVHRQVVKHEPHNQTIQQTNTHRRKRSNEISEAMAVPLQGQELAFYTEKLRSWAGHIPDAEKETLDNIISYLDSLRSTLAGQAVVTPEQEAIKDIRQATLATHLKSTAEMPHLVSSSVDLVMPGSSLAPTLRSPSAMMQSQFKADISYMLCTRDLSFQRCMLRFGWADSSPQGPYDFFLWQFRHIFASELSVTAKAMVTLITTPGGCLGGGIGDDVEISLTALNDRKEANAILKKNVLEHNSPQATLGQGHTAAEDKVSTAMHIHCCESHDAAHLLRSIDE